MTPNPKLTTARSTANAVVAELVIDALGLDASELRARVSDLEADVVAYRELAREALAGLADLTKTHDRMRTSYYQQLDERRVHQQGRAA